MTSNQVWNDFTEMLALKLGN